MHPGKERGAMFRAYSSKTIRPLISMAEWLFGKELTLDRNQQRAPCATSPTVEAAVSEAVKSGFESPVAYQFVRVAQR